MTNSDKILEFAKNNGGYILSKQVKDLGMDSMTLTRLVKKNKLERVSSGYYVLKDELSDDYYKYQLKANNCVFSYNTALFLHDLSDRTPLYFDLTVIKGYNGNLISDNNIILHYVEKNVLDLGIMTIKSPFGMDIKVYDTERTICDIIKSKNKMDIEVFSNALKKYANSKNKDLNKLMKYAKILKIEKKVREYMEVLL